MMQMCEGMGRYRFVKIWEDADVGGHGRMQVCEDMGGYRCVGMLEDTYA